jgi:nucleoid DNA-binding protein
MLTDLKSKYNDLKNVTGDHNSPYEKLIESTCNHYQIITFLPAPTQKFARIREIMFIKSIILLFIETIKEEMKKGEEILIKDLLKITFKERRGRTVNNPFGSENCEIPARSMPICTISRALQKRLRQDINQ